MAKKKTVKKAKQLPLVAKEVRGRRMSTAKFVSLSVMAVIPTQSYGNIQPKIEVQAETYEEARDFVLPHIKELYTMFAESRPGFLGKIEVTEKVVTPVTAQTVTTPAVTTPAQATAQAQVAQQAATNQPTSVKPKTEAVLKAEAAIRLAATEDAMVLIQGQIEKSTKIAEEDKPALLTLCLKRRGELAK